MHFNDYTTPYLDTFCSFIEVLCREPALWYVLLGIVIVQCSNDRGQLKRGLEWWRKALKDIGLKICQNKGEYPYTEGTEVEIMETAGGHLQAVICFKCYGSKHS